MKTKGSLLVVLAGLVLPLAAEEKAAEKPADKPAEKKAEAAPENRAQDKFSRETPELMKGWEPALEEARRATVRIVKEGKQVALGCAVHEGGYLVTKWSELHDKKGVAIEGLEAQFPEGLRMPVKIVDSHRSFDLALIKVEARGLRTMKWETSVGVEPGTFLAAGATERLPIASGVVSVLPRSLDGSHKGFLGVNLDSAGEGAIKVVGVTPDTPAAKAGLVLDDVIKSVNGEPVRSVSEFIQTIAANRPYQTIKLTIVRGMEEKEVAAVLGRRPPGAGQLAEDVRNTMGGSVSRNRSGYPGALQHDMFLEPNEVGGPVVDLKGHVVGMNIARSGRIECFAIPAAAIERLVSTAGEGKFFHPELDALMEERKGAEAAAERLKKDIEELSQRIKEAEGDAPKAEEEKEKK
jgi:S1-C subfamily serine protease